LVEKIADFLLIFFHSKTLGTGKSWASTINVMIFDFLRTARHLNHFDLRQICTKGFCSEN